MDLVCYGVKSDLCNIAGVAIPWILRLSLPVSLCFQTVASKPEQIGGMPETWLLLATSKLAAMQVSKLGVLFNWSLTLISPRRRPNGGRGDRPAKAGPHRASQRHTHVAAMDMVARCRRRA